MTLDGTNTWVISEPGSDAAVVVDPGPEGDGHLHRVVKSVEAAGKRVTTVLLTHGHDDHSGGARRFAELTGAPVRALDPAHRFGDEGLGEGDVVTAPGGLEIEVVGTPGHTDDSLTFLLPADGALLTGDTVLGRGTTVIDNLGNYLRSLDRLRDWSDRTAARRILPGHGPVLTDPVTAIDFYIDHRRERLTEIRAALAAGDRTIKEIVARVYADVDRKVWFAAEYSVRAQLAYLGEEGELPPDVRL
ncbi:MAG: MBL fold metallo-hydrolase [Streptosporangiales bacterium]|nr:MBL fold metallo-hydrolase [Streptosporangiales bacterium]